jgi:rubrerythrin
MKRSECEAIIDVLENLLKEEKRGKQFFRDAAKSVTSIPARQLLEKLVMAETEHVEILLMEKEQIEAVKHKMVQDEIALQQVSYDAAEIPEFENPISEENSISIPILELFKEGNLNELLEKCSFDDIISMAKKVEVDNFKYLVAAAKKMFSRKAFEHLIKLANEEKEHFLWLQRLQKYA